MYSLKPETERDRWEVEALFDLCFAPGREALSSYRLRDGVAPCAGLCLVARDSEGILAGAIRYWPVEILPVPGADAGAGAGVGTGAGAGAGAGVGAEAGVGTGTSGWPTGAGIGAAIWSGGAQAPGPDLGGLPKRSGAPKPAMGAASGTPPPRVAGSFEPAAGRAPGCLSAGGPADPDPGAVLPALLLGPVAVHPTRQGEGLGGALIRDSLALARALAGQGGPESGGRVLLVGDAPYYSRFGFAPLTGVIMPPPTNPERVLGHALHPGAWRGVQGVVRPVPGPPPAPSAS